MSEIKVLNTSSDGGHPVFIDDLATVFAQQQMLTAMLANPNSYNATSQSTVYGIYILSGFDTLSDGKISPGYLYFNGSIYGFDDGTTELTLGGYLVASKSTSTLRTTSTGAQYYAYNVYTLTVESTQPSDTSTVVGAFTANNIQIWKTAMPLIPAGSILTNMLANYAVTANKIATGAVNSSKIATGGVSASNLAAGAAGKFNIQYLDDEGQIPVQFGDYKIATIGTSPLLIDLPTATGNNYGVPIFVGVIPTGNNIAIQTVKGSISNTVDTISQGQGSYGYLYRFDCDANNNWYVSKTNLLKIV